MKKNALFPIVIGSLLLCPSLLFAQEKTETDAVSTTAVTENAASAAPLSFRQRVAAVRAARQKAAAAKSSSQTTAQTTAKNSPKKTADNAAAAAKSSSQTTAQTTAKNSSKKTADDAAAAASTTSTSQLDNGLTATTTETTTENGKETTTVYTPTLPSAKLAAWQTAGENSSYTVSFDTQSLKYDEKTGIITVWNKWTRKGAGASAVKDILLYSRYDVRLKTCADLYQVLCDGNGQVLSQKAVADPSWYPLSVHTLGMELCQSLNNYLLAN